jgi:hypothetical protein
VFSSNDITREGEPKIPTRKYSFFSDDKFSVFAEEKIPFWWGGGGQIRRIRYHSRNLKVKFEVWRAQGLLAYSRGITISMTVD